MVNRRTYTHRYSRARARRTAAACGFKKHTPSHGLFTHFRHRLGQDTYHRIFNHLLRGLLEDGAVKGARERALQFCHGLNGRDFTVKSEMVSRKRRVKREFLNDRETVRLMRELNEYFESKVEIPLIRYGKKQRLETLINEEALLLAKYLRDELKTWVPRVCARDVYPQGINSDSINNKIC